MTIPPVGSSARQQIINAAVQVAIDTGTENWQIAENEAYAAALDAGYDEEDAEDIAKKAGSSCPF